VFFALGLTAAVDDGAANAGLVLAVADELGLPPTACRAAILRLRRDGQLQSTRLGRSARYRASPALAGAQRRWTEHFRDGPAPWDGTFSGLLYDFPERDRGQRDSFRRAARLVGYGLLRPGLLICADDRWPQLADTYAPARYAGRILELDLRLDPQDARRIARQLWDLDQLAGRYRRIALHTRDLLAASGDRADGDRPSAITQLYLATQPIYDAIADDPALPAELLPANWPAHELGAALTAANETLGPPAAGQVQAIRARLTTPRAQAITR
jgi:phenylacetic acid degradation operon negative regulatory protein